MRYFIWLFIIVLLCSCGNEIEKNAEENSETSRNTETEFSENSHEDNSIEDTPIENTPLDVQQPLFAITLPANAHIGDKSLYEEDWQILVDGYEPLDHYPYGDVLDRRISAGWIYVYEGQCLRNGNGYPYLVWNHSGFDNYAEIGDEYSYICEVEFETYLGYTCQEYGVTMEDGMSYFWCLIFIDPSAEEGTISDWIFLNKTCFTKEDALEIAKTYKPSWK